MHMKKFRKQKNLEIERLGSLSTLVSLCQFLKREKPQKSGKRNRKNEVKGQKEREIGARRVAKTQIFSFKSVLI
jgi:hypothetical protein